jgi:hypothetical protein
MGDGISHCTVSEGDGLGMLEGLVSVPIIMLDTRRSYSGTEARLM